MHGALDERGRGLIRIAETPPMRKWGGVYFLL